MRLARHCVLLAIVTLFASVHPVYAAPENRSVVISADTARQSALVTTVLRWHATQNQPAVDQSASVRLAHRLHDCYMAADTECGANVFASEPHNDSLIFIALEAQLSPDNTLAARQDITLVGWLFTKGQQPRVDRQFCPQCTNPALQNATESLLVQLTNSTAYGTLRLTTAPSIAHIRIDGKAMGTSPLEAQLPAGPHQILIAKDGFPTQEQRIEIRTGAPQALHISLSRTRAALLANGSKSDTQKSHTLPAVLLGTGLLALAASSVLVAIDEDDIASPIGVEQPQYYRDTMPAGIALGTVGVISTGLSIYLWARNPPKATPLIALSPSQSIIGFRLGF